MKHIITVVIGAIAVVSLFVGLTPEKPFSGSAGPLHTELQEFEGGVKYGNTVSTSTTDSAMTLAYSVFKNADTVIVTPTLGDVTYTIAASSTDP